MKKMLLIGTLVIVLVTVGILFLGTPSAKVDKKPTTPTTPTTPAMVQPVKVGKTPTMYKFEDYADGCIVIPIKTYDFYWYPKGGRVTVFPPNGEPFVDTPGVDIKTHFEPGVWKWRKKDSNAIGVEVWK